MNSENSPNDIATGSWWWPDWLRWRPTSFQSLENAEKKMLEGVKSSLKSYFVSLNNDNKIQTIVIEKNSNRIPLVLLHGFAAGIGFWTLNLDDLSQKQSVYAIDLLGFGRSSRPAFPLDGAEAEKYYVQSIEEWRKKVGLERFILLGHSFGGYLACSYTLAHPERVRHLILADPWGMPEKPPPGNEETFQLPRWAKVTAAVLSLFNPLAAIRAAGPWGPTLICKFRPDLQKKYANIFGKEDTRVMDYIYHCNAQTPSGEIAFKSLSIPYGWAKYPMIHRIKEIQKDIPITVLFGSRSWMDTNSGYTIKYLREGSYVDVQIIKGAGHHIYADRPVEFNTCVTTVCDRAESMTDCQSTAKTVKNPKFNQNISTKTQQKHQLENPPVLPEITIEKVVVSDDLTEKSNSTSESNTTEFPGMSFSTDEMELDEEKSMKNEMKQED